MGPAHKSNLDIFRGPCDFLGAAAGMKNRKAEWQCWRLRVLSILKVLWPMHTHLVAEVSPACPRRKPAGRRPAVSWRLPTGAPIGDCVSGDVARVKSEPAVIRPSPARIGTASLSWRKATQYRIAKPVRGRTLFRRGRR